MCVFAGLLAQLRSLLWPLLHLASLPILSLGAGCWSQRHVPRVHGCHQRRRCFGEFMVAENSFQMVILCRFSSGYWYKGVLMTMTRQCAGCETNNFELIKSEYRVVQLYSTYFNRTCSCGCFCNSTTSFLMSSLACSLCLKGSNGAWGYTKPWLSSYYLWKSCTTWDATVLNLGKSSISPTRLDIL